MVTLAWLIFSKSVKSQKHRFEQTIKHTKEAITDWRIVKKLSEGISTSALKYVESRFKLLIETSQQKEKVSASFLPILAILAVVLFIWSFGIPIQKLKNLLYGAISGVSGAVVILLVFQFLFSLDSQDLVIYKRCLAILQQAQVIANDASSDKIEADKKVIQPKQQGEGESLMSKLRNIKIDGPEDFAANVDLYLSGEKHSDKNFH